MNYQERFITVPDELKVFVRDYAPVGAVRGLPVICLHGLTRNSADFEAVAPRIAALGRRVLAFDVRGRGLSDRDPMPQRYVPPVYAADVVHAMNELGVDRAVFVGTSMGGLITMLVAMMAQARVAAVVLNDIGPVVNTSGISRIATYVGKTPPQDGWAHLIALIKGTQGAAFPDADDAFWETMARRTGRELPDGRIAFDYDPAIAHIFEQPAAAAAPDLTPIFKMLDNAPLLVVHGVLSDILLPEGIAAMKALRPDLEVADVPRVGHAPTLEEPAAWDAMARFFSRVP
ncbi:MAG: alpha/beta hydrolase [Alphaproteobacteria bacterium]|nr:alpha/beta hydrolase [Alphaproteobacteria bacterium]